MSDMNSSRSDALRSAVEEVVTTCQFRADMLSAPSREGNPNGIIDAAGTAREYQELADKLRQALKDTQPSGWQPIETAPKHTAVDLLGHYPGKNPKPRRVPDCKLNSRGRWTSKHRDSEGRSLLRVNFVPTHWMPLPPAPGEDTQPETTPRVKALEWEEGILGALRAETPFGLYRVHKESGEWEAVSLFRDLIDRLGTYDTLDQAQAACQSDYERRVLSALEVG